MQSDHSSSHHSTTTSSTPDDKISADLITLSEQISLCQTMLAQSPTPASIDANESLLSVIGFLEACVPRMVELIEAAASGALSEETFEKCLIVNDKLTNVLGDVDKDPKDRMPLTPAAVAGGGGGEEEIEIGFDDMNISSNNTGSAATGKSEGLENDPFAGGADLLAPTPVAGDVFSILDEETTKGATASAARNLGDDEDFDAFFKDRTSASGGKQE